MKIIIRYLILLFVLCCSFFIVEHDCYICNSTLSVDQSPVIGVLAQEIWNNDFAPNNSMIVASYVKFIESSGAQVVPVLLNKNESYYNDLYGKLNGLLLPGGILLNDSIYMKTAKIFWIKATNNNTKLAWTPSEERKKNFFPIWGTCLGFEAMFDFVSGEPSRLTRCNAFDTQNSVCLIKSNKQLRDCSKMFKNAPPKIMNYLRNQNTTVNFHHRCMSMRNLTEYNLNQNIQILGTNRDKDGLEYVSLIESKYYPFYGVQFHPKAVLFEFKNYKGYHNIPHDLRAIQVSQFFGNFFVQQTRNNKNCFFSQEELNSYLIHNYIPQFTAKSATHHYMQKYFFPL